MKPIDSLMTVALDMTAALTAEERSQRLLKALHREIPFDAAALFRVQQDELVISAADGLAPDALGRRFRRKDHPRLDIICQAREPMRFPSDTQLPDPFDGLLLDSVHASGRIHSCLGCPLWVEGQLIGALTADAIDPDLFESLDLRFIHAIAALAGAQLHTIDLFEALERSAEKMGLIAQDLMTQARSMRSQEIIGSSAPMQHLRREIELVAPSDFNVLVTGETGVGKELVVRAIHAASRRNRQAMLYLNCAAFPENLAESELFGHVRGAFTGAVSDRAGKFELADGGTLFLDEIGELPLSIQPKLLRALQQGEIQRIGSDRLQTVDVRLLTATNRDLQQEVEAGRFRLDLFHRLNVYPLRVPPLRERPADVPLLAGYFCELLQRRLGLGAVRLAPAMLDRLSRYSWPGNVRELENVLSRAVLKAAADMPRGRQVLVGPEHAGIEFAESAVVPAAPDYPPDFDRARPVTLKEAVDRFKRDQVLRCVAQNNGNWASAARDLGLHRSNLAKLADRLGIDKEHVFSRRG